MANPNALFAVFAVSDAAAVERQLQTIAPWLYLKVAEGQWLVIAPPASTTKEVSDKIGITIENSASNGIVIRGDGYYGRAASSIWEWIATKTGAPLVTATPNKGEQPTSADAIAVPGGSVTPSDKYYDVSIKVAGIERSIAYLEAHAETADKKLDTITTDIASARATFTTLKWVLGVSAAGVWGLILAIVAAWAKHYFETPH